MRDIYNLYFVIYLFSNVFIILSSINKVQIKNVFTIRIDFIYIPFGLIILKVCKLVKCRSSSSSDGLTRSLEDVSLLNCTNN